MQNPDFGTLLCELLRDREALVAGTVINDNELELQIIGCDSENAVDAIRQSSLFIVARDDKRKRLLTVHPESFQKTLGCRMWGCGKNTFHPATRGSSGGRAKASVEGQ